MVNPKYHHLSYETGEANIPLLLYTMGITQQRKIIRLEGFPALHLFVNRSGNGRFELLHTKKEWTLADGQACLLPADVPHTYYPLHDIPWTHGFVTMTGNILNELIEALQLPLMKPILLKSTEPIWQLFDRMTGLVRDNGPDLKWTVSAQLYQLLQETRRQSILYRQPLVLGGKDSIAAVELAAEMIRAHYNEPLLLADYARSLGYSVQHLNRLFRQANGQTMHQYLESIRFEKCIQLLQQGMTVQDVASTLGMDANYFIRAFKRKHGMTPGQFKANSKARSGIEDSGRPDI